MGSGTKKTKMKTKIEEELVVDILRQLPVKSVLRFKCVYVEWNTLLTQPDFKMKHLNHAKNHKDFQKMLIQVQKKNSEERSFFTSSLSSRRIVKDVKISSCVTGNYVIHCCYDGLVLIGCPLGPDVWSLLLWNPSTREKVLLPEEIYFNNCMYGLGYDSTSDDYKVFKDVDEAHECEQEPNEIIVLKDGSWREISRHFCHHSDNWYPLAFVEGAFHWLGVSESYDLAIVSFDITNEVYGEVSFPQDLSWQNGTGGADDKGVTELGGMVSIHWVCDDDNTRYFNVWVMKEYGVKESWTKVFSIDQAKLNSMMLIVPKYMFEDGEMLCKRGVFFRTSKGPYDISNLIWPIQDDIDEHSILYDGCVYTESLISPRVNH